jgi:hypothetical protein
LTTKVLQGREILGRGWVGELTFTNDGDEVVLEIARKLHQIGLGSHQPSGQQEALKPIQPRYVCGLPPGIQTTLPLLGLGS